MAEPILIGTRGWDDAAWAGPFYPDILPPDWRLGFYANRLRALLVPGEICAHAAPEDLSAWLEDTHEDFRFVLELPAALSRPGGQTGITKFLSLIEPLRPRMAGLLLRAPTSGAPDTAWLKATLRTLAPLAPVCVDLAGGWRTPAVALLLAQAEAGLCWQADSQREPVPGGTFMVALSSARAPKEQRRILESLHRWQGEQGVAGLFFDHPAAAEPARLLAELMVV